MNESNRLDEKRKSTSLIEQGGSVFLDKRWKGETQYLNSSAVKKFLRNQAEHKHESGKKKGGKGKGKAHR